MAAFCDAIDAKLGCLQALEQKRGQIGGQGALETQEFAAARMLEAEDRGVQRLPAQSRSGPPAAAPPRRFALVLKPEP